MTDQKQTEEGGVFAPNASIRISKDEKLSQDLEALQDISLSMCWTWDRKIRQVFEHIDPVSWESLAHNPVLLLRSVGRARLEELASGIKSEIREAHERQKRYLESDTWFQKNYWLPEGPEVAYFSAEFGFAECFRIYSGGLGILSGDHLKSASDLGIPLVGVGLFYNKGYFSQEVDKNGWQTESYPENNPLDLPCEPVLSGDQNRELLIPIRLENRTVNLRVWKISIGRVPLFLLDTDIPELNSREDCGITSALYGGDSETRIKQEIILGFGGPMLLSALDLHPSIFHMNEGHSAFVTLERIRQMMGKGISFEEAKNLARPWNVFTTHTPVPAGIDVFDRDIVSRCLSWYCEDTQISHRELLDLGHDGNSGFNMAILAIRLSEKVNAVSSLHREVAAKNWAGLIEQLREENSGIDRVTNGVHVSSWLSDLMAQTYEEQLGSDWIDDDQRDWSKIENIPDSKIWEARCKSRADLVNYIRSESSPNFAQSRQSLSPDALTVGFSRRFATYKRANLILSDISRLSRMLRESSRPIQFIFSGKAHPKDYEAKRLIQEIVNFAKSESSRGRVIFLQNYDISLAKRLVSGVDLWLNNPRRPHEACGTSGMKTIANGGLNLSTLDGWWAEAYSPELGWAIGDATEYWDHREQDRRDSESLYDNLEGKIIPEFYDRENGIPVRWIKRIKKSVSTLTPRFGTHRMLMEYSEKFYFKERPLP